MTLRTGPQALAATYTTPEPSPDGPDGPQCLRFVWMCFGSVPSNLPPLSSVAYAKQGWQYSRMQHPGDRHPPAGAPVYFSGSDGHIAIATGNGDQVRSTEWPWGHVGTTTISSIEKTWGRTYYGWTGDILGHPITFASTAVSANHVDLTNIPTIEEAIMGRRINLRTKATTKSPVSTTLYWLSGRGGIIGVRSIAEWNLLGRWEKLAAGGPSDVMLDVERDILNNYYKV